MKRLSAERRVKLVRWMRARERQLRRARLRYPNGRHYSGPALGPEKLEEDNRREEGRRGLAEARRGLPHPEVVNGVLRQIDRPNRRASIILAPANLSFDDNREEVLGFLYYYRWRQYVQHDIGRGRPRPLVVDLRKVKEIGLDAALALTAEYHRVVLQSPNYEPCIDDAHWSPGVRNLLRTLGFYDLVKAASHTANDDANPRAGFPFKFVRFVDGEFVDGKAANRLLDELKAAAGHTPQRVAIYGALIEAIKNVRNHAYPANAPPRADRIVPRWWAAGAYFPEQRLLQFAVYDQGVGIPATLGRKPWFTAFLQMAPQERTDADIIEGAIEHGRTSTNLDQRGNGLWTICRLAGELPGSHVTIWSGRGKVEFPSAGRPEKQVFENPFCGTLIQWTLLLPQDQTTTGQAA